MQSIDIGLTDTFIMCAEQLFVIVGVFAVILLVLPSFFVLLVPLFFFCEKTPQRGLSSKKMALITSDCGTMRFLSIKWP